MRKNKTLFDKILPITLKEVIQIQQNFLKVSNSFPILKTSKFQLQQFFLNKISEH